MRGLLARCDHPRADGVDAVTTLLIVALVAVCVAVTVLNLRGGRWWE